MKDKNKQSVDCLGFCGKKFMSADPKTNRLCIKCSEKVKNITNAEKSKKPIICNKT